ncbi:MAG: transporter substrate-binding domain-containing protein [Burkholderiales bacterium]|nr:transporter substrate-binding domain-containing protein [Burkholderiales bacterium]
MAVDVLKLIAGRVGRDSASVVALPLRRCLAMVASGQLDVLANVPTAQIDPKPFLVTESYFTLTSEYVYWKKRFPEGVAIKTVDDLQRYRVCGIAGYNYEGYGLSLNQVDMGAPSYRALVHKMASGRCDLFIDKRETIAGLRLVDADLFAELTGGAFVMGALTEDLPTGLHYAFSKQMPDGAAFLARFNAALSDARRRGEIGRLAEAYLR